MKAVKCPVCEGTGQVPSWFYSDKTVRADSTIVSINSVTCRSCNGKGYVEVSECEASK